LYYFELKKEYPYQVFLLRGNHEQDFLNSLNSNKSNGYKKLVSQLKAEGVGKQKLIDWLENLPFKWETPHMLISHAGISEKAKHPYSASSANGVLYNRTALKDVGKVQVHGHDVLQSDQPHFNKKSNSWNVDTGAWTGKYLSGIRLTQKGKFKEFVQEKMHPADFTRK
jgi:serine/threonine protein phosphatase 1